MLLPFVWMLSTSLKPANEVMAMPPVWIPSEFNWGNYLQALKIAPFDRYFVNSVIVTVLSTIGELITTILAAYAFSKMKFYGKNIIFAVLLGTMMVPTEVLRSEEHTSELQSRGHLVCRLLLEKKNLNIRRTL